MILSELRAQVETSSFLSETERKAWLARLSSMTAGELQALAGFLGWAHQEKAAGELLKQSGSGLIKKGFTILNQNAYQKAKKQMLLDLEKDLDPVPDEPQ